MMPLKEMQNWREEFEEMKVKENVCRSEMERLKDINQQQEISIREIGDSINFVNNAFLLSEGMD